MLASQWLPTAHKVKTERMSLTGFSSRDSKVHFIHLFSNDILGTP
jgi:hypothetical protein